MPYVFDVVGWEDFNGDRHEGEPADIDDVAGEFVHAFDPENPEDQRYFWAFVYEPFDEWDDWYDYVDTLMDMYGMPA